MQTPDEQRFGTKSQGKRSTRRRYSSRAPLFGDPWAYRHYRPSPLRVVADLYGRPRQVDYFPDYRHLDEPELLPADNLDLERERSELRAIVVTVYQAYSDSSDYTALQLRTMFALMVEGKSLTAFAREEGVTPQAISARIYGNSKGHGGLWKAVKFMKWWTERNRSHRKG